MPNATVATTINWVRSFQGILVTLTAYIKTPLIAIIDDGLALVVAGLHIPSIQTEAYVLQLLTEDHFHQSNEISMYPYGTRIGKKTDLSANTQPIPFCSLKC